MSVGAGCTAPAPKNAPGMGASLCLLVHVQMPGRPATYTMPSHLLLQTAFWQHLPGSIGTAWVHTAGSQWQDVTAHSASQGPSSSTYIQFLLQEYRRNLGAVGSVFTQARIAFTRQLGTACGTSTPRYILVRCIRFCFLPLGFLPVGFGIPTCFVRHYDAGARYGEAQD